MHLNDIFTPKNKEDNAKLFLAVEIHESLIKSAVWQVKDDTTSVVSLGSFEMWDSEETLVNGIDSSLTEAVKGLNQEPTEVIFGLPNSWLIEDGAKIHPTKKGLIGKILKELNLKPLGMVNIADAIIAHLKTQEGVPPTAILLEIYPLKVVVSLVSTGKVMAIEEVGRSDDLSRDVEEGLARIEVEKLPARFILTDGSDLENEVQQITSYPWTEKLPFLHLPKVQPLPIDFSIRSIALAGGGEVAKSLGLESTPAPQTQTFKTPPIEDLPNLGFVPEEVVEEIVEEEIIQEESSNLVIPDLPEPPTAPKKSFKLPAIKIPSFSGFKLPKFSLPKFSFPKTSVPKWSYALFAGVPILLILVGLLVFQLFFVQYNLLVVMNPKRISKIVNITLATSSKDGTPTLIGEKQTFTQSASETAPTTGEATVGEKAVGQVTIYNLSPAPLTLKSGTKIISSNNLTYLTDKEIHVASRSALSEPPFTITPGSLSVSITASKIGAEFNLDKGLQFSVDNYPKSNVIANSDTTLTGGSSRAVKAVSKSDQDKLIASVGTKIKGAINDKIVQNDSDHHSLPINDQKITSKTFNANLNEEATSLTLDMTASQDVLVYSYSQLMSLLENESLKGEDLGYSPISSQTSISLGEPKANPDGSFTASAKVDLELVPTINLDSFAKDLTLKTRATAKKQFENLSNFSEIKYAVSPKIPFLSDLLPYKSENIHITVSTK